MDTICCNSWNNDIHNYDSYTYLVNVQLPLPNADEVVDNSFNTAFPQVLAWSTAVTGILLVVLLIKSFTSK